MPYSVVYELMPSVKNEEPVVDENEVYLPPTIPTVSNDGYEVEEPKIEELKSMSLIVLFTLSFVVLSPDSFFSSHNLVEVKKMRLMLKEVISQKIKNQTKAINVISIIRHTFRFITIITLALVLKVYIKSQQYI